MFCPFEPAVHPDAKDVDRRAAAWLVEGQYVEDQHLLARTLASRSGIFVSRCMPAADPDRLETLARWVYWGFALDDTYADRGPTSTDPTAFLPLAARLVHATESLDDRIAQGHPLIGALQDITRRFATHATPTQLARWAQGHRRWMTATAEQIAYRSRSHTPSLDDFLITRLNSVGAAVSFTAVELVLGPELPGRERDSIAVRALVDLIALVTATDNDLFSWAAEAVAHNGRDPGILDVLAAEYSLTPQQALAEAIALRDQALARYLRLREQIDSALSRDLHRFLDTLQHVVRANLDWSVDMLGARYAAEGVAAPIDRSCLWTGTPAASTTAASATPAIAWMWDDRSL
ncbi:terpene synthase family protein [Kitasatospora atroaurantiaca]|uniref:terpene synthase family protein n=1 Tax=Kitasatospora atroaurantiaca TaxID=285545 RepID=UPI0011A1017C|nr:terpene synthase family protein [Kitasatospora atroaurantiaca]